MPTFLEPRTHSYAWDIVAKCAQGLFLAHEICDALSGAHVVEHRLHQHSMLIIGTF
jgi:hypothetical protein